MAYSTSNAHHSSDKGYYAAMVMAASNYDNDTFSTAPNPAKQRSPPSAPVGDYAYAGSANGPVYGATTTQSTAGQPNQHYHSPNTNTAFTSGQQLTNSTSNGVNAVGSLNPNNVSTLSASFSSTTSVGGTKRYRHNPYGGASEPGTPTLTATGAAVSPPSRLTNPPTHTFGGPHNNIVLPPNSHSRQTNHSSHNTSIESNGSSSAFASQRQTSFGPLGGPNGSGTYSYEQNVHGSASNTNPTTPNHTPCTGNGGNHPMLDANSLSVVEQFTSNVGNLCNLACSVRGRHVLVGLMRQQNERLQIIFSELAPHIGTLALDLNACHVVRMLLDYTTPEQNQHIIHNLAEAQVLEMATNSQHSRRILQTMFERYQGPALDGVVTVIAREASHLATTQQGCITVMRIIEHGMPHQREMILEALIPTMARLTMDPYGNYVVQAILDHTDATTMGNVVTHAYRGHWLMLSCNKFASNVMEKVVRTVTGNARTMLVQELVFGDDNGSTIHTLVNDGFGNFVIQAIIDSASGSEEVALLAERIRPALTSSPYAHRIEARLKGSASGAGPAHQRHNNAQRNKAASGVEPRPDRGERRGNERGDGAQRQERFSGNHERNGGRRPNNEGRYNSGSSSGAQNSNHPTSSSNASSHEGHGVSPHVPHQRRGGR